MGKGASQKTTQTQAGTTEIRLPEWMSQAGQETFQGAKATADANPIKAYGGQITAGADPNQQQAGAMAAANAGVSGRADLDNARRMTAAAVTTPYQTASAERTGAAYMAPATQGYATNGTAPTVTAAQQGVTGMNAARQEATGMTAARQDANGFHATRQDVALAGQAPTVTGATQGVERVGAAPTMAAAQQDPAQAWRAFTQNVAPTVTAERVGVQDFDQAAAQRYMNPYQEEVTRRTADEMARRNQIELQELGDGAAAARAYGGLRHGVIEGETRRGQQGSMLDFLSRSNAEAYDRATGQFNTDRATRLQADGMNQGAELQADTTSASFLDSMLGRNQSAINASRSDQAAAINDRNRNNAALEQEARGRNQDLEGTFRLSDQREANVAAGANADRSQAAALSNQDFISRFLLSDQSATNDANTRNADRGQEALRFNADALNTASGANANRTQDASRFNADALNTAAGANADRTQGANQFNAGAMNTAAGANADRSQGAALANQSTQADFIRADTDAANQSFGANADRQQGASQFNASSENAMRESNADRATGISQFNAGMSERFLDRLLAAGDQSGRISEADANLDTRDVDTLLRTGEVGRTIQDERLRAEYDEFLRMQDAPMERYRDLGAILAGTPRNTTTTSNMTSKGKTTQNQGWLNTAMGLGSMAASAFSDRRLKTDIHRVGELDGGLGVYAYRYHWDDEPQLGVMADEVEVLAPEALGPEIDGFQTVNYEALGGA